MRHHNSVRKFGRTRNGRKALLRSLAVALITHGKINTTEAKAKELRPYVEKMVTTAKSSSVSTKRMLASRLGNQRDLVAKLGEYGVTYASRNGGYLRIIKLPPRQGDASPMAMIEFV